MTSRASKKEKMKDKEHKNKMSKCMLYNLSLCFLKTLEWSEHILVYNVSCLSHIITLTNTFSVFCQLKFKGKPERTTMSEFKDMIKITSLPLKTLFRNPLCCDNNKFTLKATTSSILSLTLNTHATVTTAISIMYNSLTNTIVRVWLT